MRGERRGKDRREKRRCRARESESGEVEPKWRQTKV